MSVVRRCLIRTVRYIGFLIRVSYETNLSQHLCQFVADQVSKEKGPEYIFCHFMQCSLIFPLHKHLTLVRYDIFSFENGTIAISILKQMKCLMRHCNFPMATTRPQHRDLFPSSLSREEYSDIFELRKARYFNNNAQVILG